MLYDTTIRSSYQSRMVQNVVDKCDPSRQLFYVIITNTNVKDKKNNKKNLKDIQYY